MSKATGSTLVDIGQLLDHGRWTGYQQLLVFLTALAIIFDGVDNQLLAISIPTIMREWGVPRTAFAPILALGLFGMMIGGALAGMVGDRFGRKAALIGSVVIFAAMTLSISLVSDLTTLGILRFISGLGLGGAIPNAAALASEFVPLRRRPFAVTLTIVCIPLGGTLAGSVAIHVLPAFGWRTLFLIGGVLPIVVAILLVFFLFESPRFLARHSARWIELAVMLKRMGHAIPSSATFTDSTEQKLAHTSVRALFVDDFRRDTLSLWLAFFSCLLGVYLGLNWVPSLLTGAGLNPTVGSAGITAFNLGGVAGAILGALAFARLGSRTTMLGMAAGAIFGALVMRSMTISSDSATMPIIVMLGVTGGLINAVQTTMYALAAQIYPTAIRATGVGSAIAVGRSGAVVSTYLGAWALSTGGSPLFFAIVAAAMLISFTALALIKRHILAN